MPPNSYDFRSKKKVDFEVLKKVPREKEKIFFSKRRKIEKGYDTKRRRPFRRSLHIKMDYLFGKWGTSAPEVETFTEHHNNWCSPLVVIGGIHVYPEGFGLCAVLFLFYYTMLRRNYRKDKPEKFYEKSN